MSTSERIAVDLGTTWTAAAVSTGSDTRMVPLGERGATMPSTVARRDGAWVVGDAAERVIAADPGAGAREMKRRLGDTTPMIVGGEPFGAERLMAELLRASIATAGVAAGAAVTLTHPANWGGYKLDLLREVGRLADCAEIDLLSEPEAAALHFASAGRLRAGERVAVYDLGGGTFDAAVVEVTADGARIVGTPQGLERFGGIDIDQIVFNHVAASLDGALSQLDSSDPQVRRGVQKLREECVGAKEALSADSEATIAVVLPSLDTRVRMTRDELETALRGRLGDTLAALDRAVASAGVGYADLAGVVLVGGSSRIPLVAERVASHTERPVLFDEEPKLVVARGAANPVGARVAAAIGTAAAAGVAAQAETGSDRGSDTGKDGVMAEQPTDRDAAAKDKAPDAGAGSPGAVGAAAKTKSAVPPPPPPPPKSGLSGAQKAGVAAGVTGAAVAGAVLFTDDVADAMTTDPQATVQPASTADAEAEPVFGSADTIERNLEAPADESMDAFDALADLVEQAQAAQAAQVFGGPADAGAPLPPPPSMGGGGGGGYDGGGGGGGGGGGPAFAPPRPQPQPQPQQQRMQPPPPPPPQQQPAPPAPQAPQPDLAEFEAARDVLRGRLENFQPPEGADPAEVQALRDELQGMIDRFQPLPGQSSDVALASLRDEFDQRVQDFVQDQKIDALIEEQQRDNAAEATTPAPTDPASTTPTDPTMPPPADGEPATTTPGGAPTMPTDTPTGTDPTAPTGTPTMPTDPTAPTGTPTTSGGTTTAPTGTPTADPTGNGTPVDPTMPDPRVTMPASVLQPAALVDEFDMMTADPAAPAPGYQTAPAPAGAAAAVDVDVLGDAQVMQAVETDVAPPTYTAAVEPQTGEPVTFDTTLTVMPDSEPTMDSAAVEEPVMVPADVDYGETDFPAADGDMDGFSDNGPIDDDQGA